jgi:hypothetical protein
VFVNGNVSSDAFYLDKPIDAGLFDHDLLFRRQEAACSSSGAPAAQALIFCRS